MLFSTSIVCCWTSAPLLHVPCPCCQGHSIHIDMLQGGVTPAVGPPSALLHITVAPCLLLWDNATLWHQLPASHELCLALLQDTVIYWTHAGTRCRLCISFEHCQMAQVIALTAPLTLVLRFTGWHHSCTHLLASLQICCASLTT